MTQEEFNLGREYGIIETKLDSLHQEVRELKNDIKVICDSQVKNREDVAEQKVNVNKLWKAFVIGGGIIGTFFTLLWSHISAYGIHITK